MSDNVCAKDSLYPDLAAEIDAMAREDQEVRFRAIDEGAWSNTVPPETIAERTLIDHRNTERMKSIVKRIGWPIPAMVGSDASGKAWSLVQHADDDHEFQAECLSMIEPLVLQGLVERMHYAYLFDRVQVGAGRPQRFGTQAATENGVVWITPLEDPEKVDNERQAHGLGSLAEYAEVLSSGKKKTLAPNWRERLVASEPGVQKNRCL